MGRTGALTGLRGRHRCRRPSGADPGHAGEARRNVIHSPTVDVAVIGGGIVGLAVAWRARTRGLTTCVLDRGGFGDGAWRVAAGMLAPAAEADPGERDLLALGIESARRWPRFAEELEEVSGVAVGYRACGSLLVARDRDEAEALERERELRERMGLSMQRMTPSRARALEPALAPTIRLALHLPDDHAVDPRRVTEALAAAARAAGAELRAGAEVAEVIVTGGRAAGAVLADGEQVLAGRVVVAAGAASTVVGGIPEAARVPVRPVKGQTIRLRDPAGPGLLDRVLRFEGGYVVPRGDGRYVLGATSEERGFDISMTAGAVHELLRDASELLPGVLELEIEELIAGLRPGTPDNAPALGESPLVEGLFWATGHYRNGVLLTPVTADLVVAELAGEMPQHPFGPARFTPAEAVAGS